MIPILYAANETSFTSNGLGRLTDAISCTVTEERNGIYELNMSYPLDGIHVGDLEVNKIIYAQPAVDRGMQPFRIRDINRSWGNRIQIIARHFCYELSYYPCPEFGDSYSGTYTSDPILYNAFKKNIGVLSAGSKPTVTKSGNTYSLLMTYPSTGPYYSSIEDNCYIYYRPFANLPSILFAISSVTESVSVKTIRASGTAGSEGDATLNTMNVSDAISRIASEARSLGSFPFTFTVSPEAINDRWSTKKQEFWNEAPVSVRELIMEGDDRILDTYGGEWEWDHYRCILHEYRGENTNVMFIYGKNITDINSKTNIDDIYTHAIAYWKGSKSSSTNSEDGEYYVRRTSAIKIIDDTYDGIFPIRRTAIIDASSDFEEEPNDDELKDYINWYVSQNKINIPKVNVTIDVVDLGSTEEYKDFIPLETVHLCDSVSIKFPLFGISTKEEVTKIVFNVLTGKNDSVTIGETKDLTLAEVISKNTYNIRKNKYDVQSWADKMAERATRASNGWYGGNIKKRYNTTDHNQKDLLIMDSDDEGSAGHVLKADKNGISGSTSGSEGTYNALIALRNNQGTIGINATAVNYGTMQSQQATGKPSYWNLQNGDIVIYAKKIYLGDEEDDLSELFSDINGSIGSINERLDNHSARIRALEGNGGT